MHRSWSHAAPSSRQERIISFIGAPGGGENMVNILPVLFAILGKATSNPHQRDANELAEFTPFPHRGSTAITGWLHKASRSPREASTLIMQASAKTAQEFFASTRSFIAQGCLLLWRHGFPQTSRQRNDFRQGCAPGRAGGLQSRSTPFESVRSCFWPMWLEIERQRSCKPPHAGANPAVGS